MQRWYTVPWVRSSLQTTVPVTGSLLRCKARWRCVVVGGVGVYGPKDFLCHASVPATGKMRDSCIWRSRTDSFPSVSSLFFSFVVKVKSVRDSFLKNNNNNNNKKTGTLSQADRTSECLSFNLFITVPFYRYSWIKKKVKKTIKYTTEYASIYTWTCIRLSTLYWNVDHGFLFLFLCEEEVMPDLLSLFPFNSLYMCLI